MSRTHSTTMEGTTMIDAVSTDGIIAKQPTRLDVPIREIVDRESIALGFRQEMLSMDDKGCVMVGIASDFIILKWSLPRTPSDSRTKSSSDYPFRDRRSTRGSQRCRVGPTIRRSRENHIAWLLQGRTTTLRRRYYPILDLLRIAAR